MQSPLSILQLSLDIKTEESFKLAPENRHIIFRINYPSKKLSSKEPLEFELHAQWEKEDKMLVLTTSAVEPTFLPWPSMREFFEQLNEEVEPFLDPASHFESRHNWLNPIFVNENKGQQLNLGCQTCLKYEGWSEEELPNLYKMLIQRSTQAVYFTLPILYLAAKGKVLKAPDRLQILLHTFGSYQASLKEKGKDSVVFPKGFFCHRYGGKTYDHPRFAQ